MTNSRIDEAVLFVVGENWMKVARVIVEAAKTMDDNLPAQSEKYEVIGQHIESLVREGRLDAQGDVKKWRFSEVRRAHPDGSTNPK